LLERTNKLLSEVVDRPTARADDYAEVGEKLLQIGRQRLGVYWLEQALERDPGHQLAHRVLAGYYAKVGNQELAVAHRRRLREPHQQAAAP
jgi:Tfp pilus assembly protein PilF